MAHEDPLVAGSEATPPPEPAEPAGARPGTAAAGAEPAKPRPGTAAAGAEPPGPRLSAGAVVAETVRKAVLTGLGAVFLTEENARRFARDWRLPKDIAGYVSGQVGTAKEEIVRVVSDEVRKFFESPALRRELVRMVSSMSVEVRAEISLKPAPRGKAPRPQVKVTSVRPRVRGERDRPREAPAERPAPATPEELDE